MENCYKYIVLQYFYLILFHYANGFFSLRISKKRAMDQTWRLTIWLLKKNVLPSKLQIFFHYKNVRTKEDIRMLITIKATLLQYQIWISVVWFLIIFWSFWIIFDFFGNYENEFSAFYLARTLALKSVLNYVKIWRKGVKNLHKTERNEAPSDNLRLLVT